MNRRGTKGTEKTSQALPIPMSGGREFDGEARLTDDRVPAERARLRLAVKRVEAVQLSSPD